MATDRHSDIRGILEQRVIELPSGVAVTDIAAKCRGAVLMLLESEPEQGARWGKPELAEWLAGPYRATTAFGNARPIGIPASSRRMPIRMQKIEDLLREARTSALDAFKRVVGSGTDISFSYAAVHSGWIERCVDETGTKGWLPVDGEGMRLTERVLSLIAVDCLVRPADYIGVIGVCGICDRVTFDPACRAKRACHTHRASVAHLLPAQKVIA